MCDSVDDALGFSGRIRTDGWVSTVPMAQAEQSLRDLRQGRGMKILVQP